MQADHMDVDLKEPFQWKLHLLVKCSVRDHPRSLCSLGGDGELIQHL